MNKVSNLVILIFLGIAWSFFAIFTKIPAEVLSPFFIAFARLFLGGAFLLLVCAIKGKNIFVAKNFKYYAVIGFFNSALPFCLFALSASHLDSGIVAILDGTVPMFEVLISLFFLKNHVDKNSILGIFIGIIGIVITSLDAGVNLDLGAIQIISIFAILLATFCYAGASLYNGKKCKHIDSLSLATGSVTFAALLLLPSAFFVDFALIDFKVGGSLLGLGLICTGIAYIFYFKLMAEESPRVAVSVVLLIPVFGVIFGAIFLDEIITFNKIIGGVMILISMKFILNLPFKKRVAPVV